MTDSERFFSKKHLIAAGWAAIFGIVGYGVRLIGESKREPEHVLVTNMPTLSPQITATAELDQRTQAQLQSMVASVQQAIREIQSSKEHASAAANAAAQARIDQLEEKVTKLQAAATSSQTSAAQASAAQNTLSGLAEALTKAQADLSTKYPPPRKYATLIHPLVDSNAAPSFALPVGSKGYMLGYEAKLLRSFTCPQPSRIRRNAGVRATFTVADPQTANQMSPLWVILMEKTTKDDGKEEWVLRYSVYTPISSGPNVIELGTDLDKGSYVLRSGYFLLNKLTGDYPPYYSRDCEFEVE